MKHLFILFTLLTVVLTAAKPSYAVSTDATSATCLAPAGNSLADYPDGTHGIVGGTSKEGHDSVYSLGNGNALQCLCATDGSGTQTNWMSIGELNEDQIKVYQNQGWIYVPDGSVWGLSQGSYLAKNTSYSCGGGSSTTQNSGGDGKSDGKSDGRSDGRSDGASTVQAATGNAAALASTGNIAFILSILGLGIFMTILGIWLRKNTN